MHSTILPGHLGAALWGQDVLLLPCTVPPCLSPAAQAPIQGSSCLLARFGSRTRATTAAARRVPEQAAASSWPQPSPPLGAGGSRVSPSPGGPLGSGFPLPCIPPPSLAVPSPGGHAAEQGCDLKRRSTEVRGQKNQPCLLKKKHLPQVGESPAGGQGWGLPAACRLAGGSSACAWGPRWAVLPWLRGWGLEAGASTPSWVLPLPQPPRRARGIAVRGVSLVRAAPALAGGSPEPRGREEELDATL